MIGAYSAEIIVSSAVLAVTPRKPPQPLRIFGVNSVRTNPSTFGVNSTSIVKMKEFDHALGVELRPVGKELERRTEILGTNQRRLQRQRKAYHQQYQPQGR